MKIKTRIISYILTIILSTAFLYFGHLYTAKNLTLFENSGETYSKRVKITKITNTEESIDQYLLDAGIQSQPDIKINFEAKVLNGENKGEKIKAVQLIDGYMSKVSRPVEKGNTVYLYYSTEGDYAGTWMFADYDRLGKIIILLLLFFVALIIFGRFQGINTIISLSLTCLSVLWVFIPAVLTGKNIYLWSILTCVYSIIVTLIIVYGIDKKSICATLGCSSGILIAGVLTLIMDKVMSLTGFVNQDCYYLTEMNINLRALIFGAILIGAMGAIMDISISISSSLYEVRDKAESITISDLIGSGFTIGRDILGTMSNTLVLAYIGSSLSVILVLCIYSASILELLNRERIIVELLQSLVGIIAILGTIPLTSIICGFIYRGKNEDNYLIVHKDRFESEE